MYLEYSVGDKLYIVAPCQDVCQGLRCPVRFPSDRSQDCGIAAVGGLRLDDSTNMIRVTIDRLLTTKQISVRGNTEATLKDKF